MERVAAYRLLYPSLYELALAIQAFEGYSSHAQIGTRAWRNENPGNLRAGAGAIGTTDGFAVFPDYWTGMAALLGDLWAKCSGHTRTGLGPDSTIADLIAVYAPPVENKTSEYLAFVLGRTHCLPSTKLRTLLEW